MVWGELYGWFEDFVVRIYNCLIFLIVVDFGFSGEVVGDFVYGG